MYIETNFNLYDNSTVTMTHNSGNLRRMKGRYGICLK